MKFRRANEIEFGGKRVSEMTREELIIVAEQLNHQIAVMAADLATLQEDRTKSA